MRAALSLRGRYPGLNLRRADPAEVAAEVVVFGFWVFLMSDAVLFSLLFAVYQTLVAATAQGPSGASLFRIGPALTETLVLLTSSFTFGLASVAMKHRRGAAFLQAMLLLTLILGVSFLALEAHDFLTMAAKGAVPQRSAFLSAFYVLLSTHFLHVVIGCVWIVVMLVQINLWGFEEDVVTRLLRLGIFWHFLDIVWVVIFTFVYLRALA